MTYCRWRENQRSHGRGLEGPEHTTNHRMVAYHIKHSLSSSFLRPGVPWRAFWLLCVSAGIKVSRNHQSERNRRLGSLIGGKAVRTLYQTLQIWSLRIESQTTGS